jgi:integration host factor subunit alpha|tara:strand:- start:2437 stop:2712 length:276 start_codon:yes stop_codon:yes gene_type:complete
MSLSKKDISKNISTKANIKKLISSKILDFFILDISNKSKENTIKISNFGSFFYKTSPERIGRNPKTKNEYKISERKKLNFRASNKIKDLLN